MSGIYFLASFPKSGNTWVRIFLENYLRNNDNPVSINDMKFLNLIASNRNLIDEYAGVESSLLTNDEIDDIRADCLREAVNRSSQDIYLKMHDALIPSSLDKPLIPYELTLGAVYMIRNPFDVAASYANHSGKDLDEMVKVVCKGKAIGQKNNKLHLQLRQRLENWSKHVISWIDQDDFPVLLIRYEDLKLNEFESFHKIVTFLGLEIDKDRVRQAIEFSSFEQLQEQEEEKGFLQRMPKCKQFFRKGVIGSGLEELNQDQISRIIAANKGVMRRFGYLTKKGEINLTVS